MPSLKDLKVRIDSVKSTRKITSAMKMVAASKLRRAQEQADAARPYAERMARMIASLSANLQIDSDTPALVAGTGKSGTVLLLVMTGDRGLCGAFNSNVAREARRRVRQLQGEGKTVKILCVGRKGRDLLRRDYPNLIIQSFEDVGRKKLAFADADKVAAAVLTLFADGAFDECHLVANHFKSVISQVTTVTQLIPVPLPAKTEEQAKEAKAVYEFEPDEASILAELLPHNLSMQLYRALLDNAAGEQGARMTAMDNATRNAGDMINRLTLNYNRARQAYITKEMIEIISGAEAV